MNAYEKIGYSILGTVALVMQGAAELLAYGTAVKVRRRSIEI